MEQEVVTVIQLTELFPECHLLRVTQLWGKLTVLRWGRGWVGGGMFKLQAGAATETGQCPQEGEQQLVASPGSRG